MSKDKTFADGFLFKRRENAPDFVIGNISVKVDEAITFLQEQQKNGWVNLNVLTAKSGKPYIELDTWEAKPQGNDTSSNKVKPTDPELVKDDLPF